MDIRNQVVYTCTSIKAYDEGTPLIITEAGDMRTEVTYTCITIEAYDEDTPHLPGITTEAGDMRVRIAYTCSTSKAYSYVIHCTGKIPRRILRAHHEERQPLYPIRYKETKVKIYTEPLEKIERC